MFRKFIRKGCSSSVYKTKASLWNTILNRIEWIEKQPTDSIAVKTYNRYKELYYRELNALKRLTECAGVCRLIGYSPSYHSLYLELGDTDLYSYIEKHYPLSVETIHTIITNVVECVLQCHRENIAHLDIKPENILIRNKDDLNSLCLIDFNSCSDLYNPHTILLTTKSYRPPCIKPNTMYTVEQYRFIDYWQVGMLAYILFTKHIPIGYVNWEYSQAQTIPKKAQQFITSLITNMDSQTNLAELPKPYW